MKSRTIIKLLALLFSSVSLFAQKDVDPRSVFPFCLVTDTNVVLTVADFIGNGEPCPLKYTNVLSNTNLFSVSEQKLLSDVSTRYRGVTSNSGPPGTVFTGRYKSNAVMIFGKLTNESEYWISRFRYTNSDAEEDISIYDNAISSRCLTNGNNGYRFSIVPTFVSFEQLTNGEYNGLYLGFTYPKGFKSGDVPAKDWHLAAYGHYTNGMFIGQLLMWLTDTGRLVLDADFKKPYDMRKHQGFSISP